MCYTATVNPRYRVFLRIPVMSCVQAHPADFGDDEVDGVRRKPGPSSESGTAEGIITRRLLYEMAGYLCLLPAVGWAWEEPYGD